MKRLNKKLERNASKKEIVLLLQDVENAVNIGSIFRATDALRITNIYLSEKSSSSPHPIPKFLLFPVAWNDESSGI